LSKISASPGIAMDKIISEFTKSERDNIYPSLGQRIVAVIVGELELLGYVDVNNDGISITDKGRKKLAGFIKTLTAEEKKALKL
jgi:ribosomal protein S19E (S16A)